MTSETADAVPAHLVFPTQALAAFCGKWQIAQLALFGSILRDDFRPDSDVDVLVAFQPAARHTLFDLVHMQTELAALMGREVDLVEKSAIERSRNPLRRSEILGSAKVIYAS